MYDRFLVDIRMVSGSERLLWSARNVDGLLIHHFGKYHMLFSYDEAHRIDYKEWVSDKIIGRYSITKLGGPWQERIGYVVGARIRDSAQFNPMRCINKSTETIFGYGDMCNDNDIGVASSIIQEITNCAPAVCSNKHSYFYFHKFYSIPYPMDQNQSMLVYSRFAEEIGLGKRPCVIFNDGRQIQSRNI